ncbi:SAVED domain-containing protein [Bradyrhizobium sp. Ash2021]|nr:SAVED domain-containing protein [Bradyrhizobium sp. Ash2021]
MIEFALGPSQRSVLGGDHAAALAESVANHLRSLKGNEIDVVAHVFAAAPNALLFYLGQQHQAIAPCVVYEYDFDRRGKPTYPTESKDAGSDAENQLIEKIQVWRGGADMGSGRNIETRFAGHVEDLSSVLGYADRVGPLRDYCTDPMAGGFG